MLRNVEVRNFEQNCENYIMMKVILLIIVLKILLYNKYITDLRNM